MDTVYELLIARLGNLPDGILRALSILVPIGFILAVYPLIFAFTTWVERKALGRIQNRYGPNRVGPKGLLQPIADGVKLLIKEDIVPNPADKLTHFLAPVLIVVPALLVLAVLPVGPGLVPVDLNIGLLFAFAISTVAVLALFMGGWASRNKFSLLGAMRAVAQVVSYEVPMVLAAVAVVMVAGSLSTVAIVEAQRGWFGWYIFRPWGFIGFVIFVIGAMAESARTPFDLPEAESELVAGYHTEYSGFKFALFQMGEYLASIGMAGITVTMFLGGYSGPGCHIPVVGMFWFFLKLAGMIALNIWIRGTWPRVRVDQLLGFAWKLLLPLAIINIFATGLWHFMAGSPVLAWVTNALILAAAFVFLAKLTASGNIEKRTYRYAD